MHEVGFDPTHLSISAPKADALDHSAIRASLYITFSSLISLFLLLTLSYPLLCLIPLNIMF